MKNENQIEKNRNAAKALMMKGKRDEAKAILANGVQ